MKIYAIIPARGGKGVPQNGKDLRGKPLIGVIEAACAPEITRVIVNTDDAEIAAARAHGGKCLNGQKNWRRPTLDLPQHHLARLLTWASCPIWWWISVRDRAASACRALRKERFF